MDILIRMWAHILLALVGLTIGTFELFGIDTIPLWRDVLPSVRMSLGLG